MLREDKTKTKQWALVFLSLLVKVLKGCKKALEKQILFYFTSNKNIYTMTEIWNSIGKKKKLVCSCPTFRCEASHTFCSLCRKDFDGCKELSFSDPSGKCVTCLG